MSDETQVVKKKKKWLVPVIIGGCSAVLVAIAAIIVAIVVTVGAPKRALQKQLDLGKMYMTELDYENAIPAYEEALKIDPKNVEAYLGLADAYLGIEDYDAALDTLEKGLEQTESEEIQFKRDEVEQLIQEVEKAKEEAKEEEILAEEAEPQYEIDEEGWAVFSKGKVTIKLRENEYIISLETSGIDDVYYCDDPELEMNYSYYFWDVMFTDGTYDYRIGTTAWKFEEQPYETTIYDMDSAMDIRALATDEGYRSTTPDVSVEGNKLVYSGQFVPKLSFEKLPEGFNGVDLNKLVIKGYSISDAKGYDAETY